jgi:peptidoglycan/LPS O-acetylase OafA/YrhL
LKRSRLILYAIVIVSFVAAALAVLESPFNSQITGADVAASIVTTCLLFTWCQVDSNERQVPMPNGARLFVALFALLGVPYYYFRSSPPLEAAKRTAMAVLFGLVMLVAAFLGDYVARIWLRAA